MHIEDPLNRRRRQLIGLMPLVALASLAPSRASAQDVLLQPGDSEAVSMHYVTNAADVDRAAFPKYAPGQNCRTCAMYMGEPDAATGPCGILFGKVVAATGWCDSWEAKPG
jgi:hypothetical protein